MKFLLLLYADERAGSKIPPEDMAGYVAQMYSYAEELAKAGSLIGTNALHPSADARTVTVRDGSTGIEAGPYAAGPEQIGGYFIIEVADLDAAVHLASRCPAATWGSVELRQIRDAPL